MNHFRKGALGAACAALVSGSALPAAPDFGPIGVRGNPSLEAQGKYIDQRIADFMKDHAVPGLAMAIVQAPYIPRSAGYGHASTQYDELASTKTMWNIGPITQGFTAVAIFQLYESKKLDLQDAVGKYVKGLPGAWRDVTIFQLLQHSAGIPDYRQSPSYASNHRYRGEELVALVASQPLMFAPGTQVKQSASNFALLGMIIEKVSGMSYYDFIKRYQIQAVGLRSTMFAEDFKANSRQDRDHRLAGKNQHTLFASEASYINPVEQATGYANHDGALSPTDAQATDNLFAFGDIWSSAEDISAWDIALAGSVLIKSADNRAILYGPSKLTDGTVVPAMGGWEFTHHPGFMDVKGTNAGFSAYLSRFTAQSELVCVTLLANKEGLDLTGLARDIAESYKAGLGSGLDSDKISNRESEFSVDETVSRLTALLRQANTPVFATVDHTDNAVKAGLQLRPTRVVVFGNPKVGTQLMLDQQASSLDLPLRVAVWEDERGRVWVGYHNMRQFAVEWQLGDEKTAVAVNDTLDNLVRKATSAY